MIKVNPQQAAEVYEEFYKKYMTGVEPVLQYRLAVIYYKKRNLDLAARCLECVLKTPGVTPDVQERALYQYASILDEMGLADAAHDFFRQFLAAFPGSPAATKVKLKLGVT